MQRKVLSGLKLKMNENNMELILTYENRLNSVQQNIHSLNQNDYQCLGSIVINMSQIFAEVRDSNVLSEHILPQLEFTVLALESKTQKSFGNIIADLNTHFHSQD